MTFDLRNYRPPGAVGAAFLHATDPVRFIMGPIGSGKTNLCFFDGIIKATQMPVCTDGIRHFSGLIFRDTYTKLWDTVIKSWWQWYPPEIGKWSGVRGRQANHALRFGMPDGHDLEMEIQFRALDEQHSAVEDALKGVEASWAHIEEADTLNEDVLTHLLGRVMQKRSPPHRLLPPEAFTIDKKSGERTPNYFAGVVGSLNPPDVDNYVYKLFEEIKPKGYRLFKQPSGLSPRGENRQGVSRKSYEDLAQLHAHKPWYVKRMVHGEYGPSRDGMPVYQHYRDDIHCAEEPLEPLKLPLRLSFDQGVNGAAMVIHQLNTMGQIRVLDEVVPGYRMGPTIFAQNCRAFLNARYPAMDVLQASCDMAGFAGQDREGGDHAWAEIVARVLDIVIEPCPTFELGPRIDCISQLLSYFPEGQPALIISPTCMVLRKGLNSHYCYHLSGDGESKNLIPKKNMHANVVEALQYGIIASFGLEGILAGTPSGELGRGRKGSYYRRGMKDVTDDDDLDNKYYPVANSSFNVLRS